MRGVKLFIILASSYFSAGPPLQYRHRTATTLLFNVAVGFLAATLVGAHEPDEHQHLHRAGDQPVADDDADLNDFLGADK